MGMEPEEPIEITCEYCGKWFPHTNKEEFLCDNCLGKRDWMDIC